MKKVSILLTILLFCATSIFAQKLSFQAVVRNNANELVPNTTLNVAISVLDASNNVQYSETHTGVQTNQNGLLSLMVGDGTPTSATTMTDVVWNGASIRTVITLPGGATITNTTPVNAVPYALSAGNVDPAVVADAIADYLAHHSVGGEDNVQADWEETDPTSDAYIQHKPTLFDGDYNSLSNKPTIPTVPANVSEFNNDAEYVTTTQLNAANYITAADIPEQVNADWDATSGAAQILNKPTIPTVPTEVSIFNNDAGYITQVELNGLLSALYITIDSLRDRLSAIEDSLTPSIPIQNVNLPTVITNSVSEITMLSAKCSGNVLSEGDSPVSERGFCWGLNPYPTITGNASAPCNEGLGAFERTIGNLYPGTTYFLRAYATNSYGTSYGDAITFTTSALQPGTPCPGTPTISDFDGNTYNTILIGEQCWMNENLRTMHYSDGDSIRTGSYTYPNNDQTTVTEYGYLYNWYTAMHLNNNDETTGNVQGICPNGWHIPSYSEWDVLRNYIGQNYLGLVNLSGFSVQMAGREGGLDFGTRNNFWTSTYVINQSVALRFIDNYMNISNNAETENAYAKFSVRCIRDEASGGGSTSATLPIITTNPAINITATTATSGGNVTSDGGASVSARGICWSIAPNPSIADSHTNDGDNTGSFTTTMTGLQENTTYYIRAYATNSVGTSYGEEISFTTLTLIAAQSCPGTPTVTDRDGNIYNTVLIGDQCWMRENLKTTKYSDGTPIPAYTGSSLQKFYYNTSITSTFGLLYNWRAAMNTTSSSVTGTVQGICPTGWHMPSTTDYSTLSSYVSSTYPCGSSGENALASTTDWFNSTVICSSGYNLIDNNSSGFSALPAGGYNVISNTSGYTGQNTHAYFWCSETDSYSNKNAMRLQYDNCSNFCGNTFASNMTMTACSVRCLRD